MQKEETIISTMCEKTITIQADLKDEIIYVLHREHYLGKKRVRLSTLEDLLKSKNINFTFVQLGKAISDLGTANKIEVNDKSLIRLKSDW